MANKNVAKFGGTNTLASSTNCLQSSVIGLRVGGRSSGRNSRINRVGTEKSETGNN